MGATGSRAARVDDGVLMNEDMELFWVPRHRATTPLGATRITIKCLREWGVDDVDEYLREGPSEVTQKWLRDRSADPPDEYGYDPDFPWHACDEADEGAVPFWEVSWA